MRVSFKVLAQCTALALAFGVSPVRAAAITMTSPGAEYGGGLYTLGFKFTVNSSVTMTHMGIYDSGQDGLQSGGRVGLWDTAGNLLTSAVVLAGNAAMLDGYFRYAAIAGYNLIAGTEYVIGSYTTDLASSLFTGQGGSGSVDANVNLIEDRFSNFNSAFSFADTTNNTPGAWLGANFRWESSRVSAPGTLALVGLSLFGLLAAGRRR